MGNNPSFDALKKLDKDLEGGVRPSPAEIDSFFSLYDKNHDELLQRDEAIVLCRHLVDLVIEKAKMNIEEAKKASASLPPDLRQGLLQKINYEAEMLKLAASSRETTAADFFERLDVNSDGLIQKEEFMRLLDLLGKDEFML